MNSLDIVVLAKLISLKGNAAWTQNSMAVELCLSSSQINSAFKRLVDAGLVTPYHSRSKPVPIAQACEEYFIHGFKYSFPAKLGRITRGTPTSYAAPALNTEIAVGNEPLPVWPYALGEVRGVELPALHPSVPESIEKFPDPIFYDILSLLDAIRTGRAREKQIACQKLSAILKS